MMTRYYPMIFCVETGKMLGVAYCYTTEQAAARVAIALADRQEKLTGEEWEPIVREVNNG